MNLRIRPARGGDVPELVRLHKESLPETYGTFLTPEATAPWIEGEATDRYMETRWPRMLVGEVEGEVAGFACLEGPFVELLWICNGWRGRGIGAAFMDWIENAAAGSHDAIELECYEPNEGARRFYERRGYRVVSSRFNEKAGVEDLLMRKELTQ